MEALEEALKEEFKASFFFSLCLWLAKDKRQLPPEYISRMEAGFVEGFALLDQYQISREFHQRLVAFQQKLERLENEFAHLL
jgi:hypothetical protein